MPNVTLRLTDEQHATLVAAAEDNRRSMQGEIVHRLFRVTQVVRVDERGMVRDAGIIDAEQHFKPDPKPKAAEKKGRR